MITLTDKRNGKTIRLTRKKDPYTPPTKFNGYKVASTAYSGNPVERALTRKRV